ncbi:4'-phosphopantetheinyl transferase superfamily protein [Aeromonas hydrophila]|uniref:4'-phosphopantetheinyl transferase family protein n=1 Tax=Aeromonas hydrophila TaxID=644 RepID=UPI0005D9A8FF|nr:4'-phosphopantetheinyl transferase superfamily protein [Aeromonas hydrophila]AKA18306.1 4-phosphopantetheinyl transferase [Aeromonas hydrophila]HAT2247915.1 4'-phosphopantetheinyl transferase superfamily protein [Aeromonas hydrophila]HAT2383197.1 4'-phosphopantetheinyl transferase superfamily protein [Aeromonas hydrophila]HAT2415534.1 4'-phosphopantetheinyl transferase superfamily protein [Aeromonas hydrophila]HAT2526527.1 4'-phosphopantetheinyl transferase superfamily protein [Aeromonas hy
MISVDLYLLKPANTDAYQLSLLQTLLSPEERQTWQSIGQLVRRQEYLLSRGLLRRLLAERLQCRPDSLQFCSNPHGKPTLRDGRWQFNLSHSGDWLAIALCAAGPLGVDIEMGQRRRQILPLARRFYAQSEYEWLLALPEAEQESAFYRLWSRKEAVLKAHGAGIAAGLDKVCFVPQQAWRLDNQLDEQDYQVQDWPIGRGWLSLAAPTLAVNGWLLNGNLNSVPINPMLTHTIFQESAS